MATAKLGITVTRNSSSVANNTSSITVRLYYYGNGVSYSGYQEPGTLTIDGTKYTFTDTFTKDTDAQLLFKKTKTVKHNSDGTKKVTVKGTFSPTHTTVGSLSTSTTVTLKTIPRKSDVSMSRTSIPADGATTMTVTATKKSSSFTDTITVALGSKSKNVSSGVAFTIPAEWCSYIGSTSISGTATITVITKSGSTEIGRTTKSLTVTVPATSAFLPTVSQSISDATSIYSTFSRYLKGQSKLKVTASGSGKYGATISSYSTTIAGLGTYSGSSITSGLLNTTGSVAITTTVKDSRGRSGSKTTKISVTAYSPPGITSIDAYLCDAEGNKDPSGTYAYVKVVGRTEALSGNTRTVTIQYKDDTASSWTTVTSPTISGSPTFTATKLVTGLDPSKSYTFQAKVADKLYSTDYKAVRLSAIPISVLAGGKGVKLFGEATDEGFWVGNIDYTISDDEFDELMSLLGA